MIFLKRDTQNFPVHSY